jgi:excisionase family DNA binding protein
MSEERLVTIEELAKHFSISTSTARSWVRTGAIPEDTYIRVGQTYRFHIPTVSRALTRAMHKSNEEANEAAEDINEKLKARIAEKTEVSE